MIDDFFLVVLNNLKDTIPKIVGYFLVDKSVTNLQEQLRDKVNEAEQPLTDFLVETPSIT